MSDPNSLSARRRSLARLLDYALNEAEDLELSDVAHFVALATTILQNMRKPPIKRRRKKALRDTVVDLAVFREQQGAMLGRSSSRRRK